jgi:hypothetical protein
MSTFGTLFSQSYPSKPTFTEEEPHNIDGNLVLTPSPLRFGHIN